MSKQTKHTAFGLLVKSISLFMLLLVFAACGSTTRFIADGQYLLNKVELKVEGEGPSEVDLLPFIQQTPNSSWEVGIYNSVDTTSSRWRNWIRKIGEPGVVFKKSLVDLTENELSLHLKNLGYLNVDVSSEIDTLNKKAAVTYKVIPNEPYRVRNYKIETATQRTRRNRDRDGGKQTSENNIPGVDVDSTKRSFNPFRRQRRDPRLIKEGSIFDMNVLEQERQRVNRSLQNRGYYASNINNLHYWADTTLRTNQVDLKLGLLDSTVMVPYTIERVNVFLGENPFDKRNFHPVDSSRRRNIHMYWDDMNFLRSRTVADKIIMRPKDRYSLRNTESVYNQFKALNCVGRVDIQYAEGNYPDSTLLDCNIYVSPGNIHSLQAGIEGTNKDGDIGVALDVNYGHLNLFNGSETFNINMRAAYEFVKSSGDSEGGLNNNYYEFGIKPSLAFPKLHLPIINSFIGNRYLTETQYSLGYTLQKRSMFMRNFFNFNWKFRFSKYDQKMTHAFSLLDINYVNMPWKSSSFDKYLNNEVDSLTKFSYNNIFTAGINYALVYSNINTPRAKRHAYTFRFNVETSGILLNWLNKKFDGERNSDGQYTILGNPFAQYVKSDISIAETFQLSPRGAVAFRVGAGVAYPYGNSTIMPFEKRYYGGGPNHVRGWSTRELGPGTYNNADANIVSHVGDINFIASFEYRLKAMSWFEPAWFIDAGNIWTIKDYPNQAGGKFEWDSFYKELAVGTGIGFRLDLSFLVLRLDLATRLVDPARSEGNRWVLGKDKFFKNSAWYVAIGYPF